MLTKQVLYLRHTSSPFCSGYFGDRVSQNICLVWSQVAILLISLSQVAMITGVSHWHLASFSSFIYHITLEYKHNSTKFFASLQRSLFLQFPLLCSSFLSIISIESFFNVYISRMSFKTLMVYISVLFCFLLL
jgi:hypothetical protein